MRYGIRLTRLVSAFLFVAVGVLSAQQPQITYLQMNEGTGTTTSDGAQPGLSAVPTLGPAASWNTTNPRLGASCLSFSGGTAAGLQMGVPMNFGVGTSWTIEMWLFDITTAANTALRYTCGDSGTSQFRIFAGGVAGTGNIILRGTGITDTFANGAVIANTWVHIAFVYDSTVNTITPYVNGVAGGPVAQTAPLSLGGSTAVYSVGFFGTAGTYSGSIDEFRVWNVARTGAEILGGMNSEVASGPIDSVRFARPFPSVVFSPGNSTFSVTGTVQSYVTANGITVATTAGDALIGSTVTVFGSYTGNDLIGLSDITFAPATVQMVVAPGTDELTIVGTYARSLGAADRWTLGGNLVALPVVERALGQGTTPTVNRVGSGSRALDQIGSDLQGSDTLTILTQIEPSGPVLASLERNYQGTPLPPASALATDGLGSAVLGVVGLPPFAEVYNLFAINNTGAIGAGPLFGLPLTQGVFEMLTVPFVSQPIKVYADLNGVYLWGRPFGSVPAGMSTDILTLGIAQGGTTFNYISPVTRVTF